MRSSLVSCATFHQYQSALQFGLSWFLAIIALGVTPAVVGDGGYYQGPASVVLTAAELPSGYDFGTVTDVALLDFDTDGRRDVVAAWYATDIEKVFPPRRILTLFRNTGVGFEVYREFDLYIPDENMPALSVFYQGTSEIAVGDFDGDGDDDLAVFAFFGDEMWLIENMGDGDFAKYLRYPFDINSSGMFITPPEALAADFDGDGREELVYIADPIHKWDGYALHFWKSDGTIAGMHRVFWEGVGQAPTLSWRRGLAVADFDGDGMSDLCFGGEKNPSYEVGPVLVFWHGLELASGTFAVHCEVPTVYPSDVIAVRPNAQCLSGVLVCDVLGREIEYWAHACAGEVDFTRKSGETGYAALRPVRGMIGVAADIDGDGDADLVTKQQVGRESDRNQIEVTTGASQGAVWTRVEPSPVDTLGFVDEHRNPLLRPRNLAVGDLVGNTLPEVVAGFGLRMTDPDLGTLVLEVAIWVNGCVGDADLDGDVDFEDLVLIGAALETCEGDPDYSPLADLDKNGCVTRDDWQIAVDDLGCNAAGY